MSRSNKNNGRKKLFKSESETRCPSSSSSSNSEDGDATNRNAAAALDPRSSPYPAGTRVLGGAGAAAAALKGGSEAPTDLVYEYLTRDRQHRGGRQPGAAAAADKIRTNLKIVRIRKFQSNESKVLLIVDVPPAVRQQQLEQQQKQQQPPPPMPPQSATVGGGCAPVEPAASLEMGSREIFELSDELAKKFDVDRETAKSFEWRSFSRPDDVIKLLLNDGAVKPVAGGHDEPLAHGCAGRRSVGGEMSKAGACASIREDEAAPDGEGRDGGAAAATPSKPATKRKRVSADRDSATEFERDEDDDGGHRRAADEARIPPRSRSVRGLLGRQANVPDAAGYRGGAAAGGQRPPSAVPRNGVATEAGTGSTVDAYRDTMVDETWKILKNCATLRRENADTLHVLLGEDNAKGVSNCGADTSTSDANDDALNSSNSDDNDAKAKKKNRCALCRKKVGLTGFECRCGGLYCGMHRYSDKHNCTFDYRQLGAQEIRRNNPVVIGEKIQKI